MSAIKSLTIAAATTVATGYALSRTTNKTHHIASLILGAAATAAHYNGLFTFRTFSLTALTLASVILFFSTLIPTDDQIAYSQLKGKAIKKSLFL